MTGLSWTWCPTTACALRQTLRETTQHVLLRTADRRRGDVAACLATGVQSQHRCSRCQRLQPVLCHACLRVDTFILQIAHTCWCSYVCVSSARAVCRPCAGSRRTFLQVTMFVTEGALVQDACMAVDCPDLRGEAYMVSWLVQLGSAAGRTLACLACCLLELVGTSVAELISQGTALTSWPRASVSRREVETLVLNNAKRNIPRFQLVKCASCSSRHVRTRSEPKCSLIPARYVSRKTHFGELLEMLSELMIEEQQ